MTIAAVVVLVVALAGFLYAVRGFYRMGMDVLEDPDSADLFDGK